MTLTIVIAAVILVVVAIWAIVVRNSIVQHGLKIDNAKGQIATQHQRRYDLIPNLVKTVETYAKHERSVLDSLTQARADASHAASSNDVRDIAKADDSMHRALTEVNAVAENYPDLKASSNFAQLQEELTTTENKVASARQSYNDSVFDYNNKVQAFPNLIVAKAMKRSPEPVFEVDTPEAAKPVQVSFDL